MRFFSSTPLVLHSFESACKEIRASQASCSWELNQCRVLCVCVCVCVCVMEYILDMPGHQSVFLCYVLFVISHC